MYRERCNVKQRDRQFWFLYLLNGVKVSKLWNVYMHEELKLCEVVILIAQFYGLINIRFIQQTNTDLILPRSDSNLQRFVVYIFNDTRLFLSSALFNST